MTAELPPFDAAYARAREIARYAGNFVRTCDGEDLLGRPHFEASGHPLRGPDGRVLWEVRPRAGFDLLPDGCWLDVPFLAPLLQIKQRSEDGRVGLRVTPEVRLERIDGFGILVRTLTIELTVLTPDRLKIRALHEFSDRLQPIVRAWYPLHETVVRETVTGELLEGPIPSQPILFRFRGRHEDPHRPLAVEGTPVPVV